MSKPRKHRRKRSKRSIRCSMCTPHRWMGNNAGRFKAREEDSRKRAVKEIETALSVAA